MLAVVVSELMASNDSTLADEDGDYSDWLELHNTGPLPVDLDGWYLTDRADRPMEWQLPSVTLEVGQHLIVYASGKDRQDPTQPLHTSFNLSADGEYLGLVRRDGMTTEFAYAPHFPPLATDVSFGLSPEGNIRGFFAAPTPGTTNSQPTSDAGGNVIISEIMYSLPRDSILTPEDTRQEFIELYNRGATPVDVTDWQITRGVTFTFPNAIIQSGDSLVVAANLESFRDAHPAIANVVGNWEGKLSNSGERIQVVDAAGLPVDAVRYADEGDWSVRTVQQFTDQHDGWTWQSGHDGGGKSLELINVNQTNDHGQNWAESILPGGTPGQSNSVTASKIAPLISAVRHDPSLPSASDPVVISAAVDDPAPGLLAWVEYRTDPALSFERVAMHDDGLAGDGIAGDGIYSATLPAQADRSVVEFYVGAEDDEQRLRTWPAQASNGQQDANAIYQVIDEFDASQWQPGDTPIYHVIMTPQDRQVFENMPRGLDAQFNATFVAVTGTGIDVRYNAGIRFRGSGSRNDPVPNNRVNLPHDNAWQGITAFNLNQNNPVSQVAGSALFRLGNVPAADVRAVRLFSNGVDLKNGGFYAHSETLDSDYSQNHFPLDADGNLYRGRRSNESPRGGRGAGLRYFGTDPAPYVSYIKSTNASAADWSDVIDLTFVLDETTDDHFVEEVRRVIDVEQWFRTIAMNSLIANNEFGLLTGDPEGDDFALYRGVNDTRFQMVPYDWDSLFTNVNESIFRSNGVPALNRLVNHPAFLPDFFHAYQDLIDNVIRSDDLRAVLAESLRSSPGRVDGIYSFLLSRADAVERQISTELTARADLEQFDDVYRSTTSQYTVTGEFPRAGTHAIRVDGQLAELGTDTWNFSSNAAEVGTALVPVGATWKYLDDGSDQGTAWRGRDFDDTSWNAGPAQLGYGDDDEATIIDFGGDNQNRFATSYFRTEFQIDDADNVDGLLLDLIYDDGAAVYLNGFEVVRVNLPENAGFNEFATRARGGSAEDDFESFELPAEVADQLVNGVNVVAVEVHQTSAQSPDVSFDLRLRPLLKSDPKTSLRVGMNRIAVTSFLDAEGTGQSAAETNIDIWFDHGAQTMVNSNIDSNATWTRENSPYRVQGDVSVSDGATLMIDPGVTVFFEDDASLIVRGMLKAVGTSAEKIWFTRLPGQSSWDGIQFRDSQQDNEIEHAILQYGISRDGMIGLDNSRLSVSNSLFDHTDRRRIRSIDSSLIVRDSVFEDIFAFGEQPTSDNQSEHIWGSGIPEGGHWIVEGNSFGTITGHNDGIDFDSEKDVGRFAQILNNRFLGGGDDALDVTGDFYIEGNVITNYRKDRFNNDPGQSNAISASDGEFWVIRNVFDQVQHASLVKEDAFMHFLNNTVISSEFAPLYFDLPGQTSGPGRGAIVAGSVFADTPTTFDRVLAETDLTVESSFLPSSDVNTVTGPHNQFGDPHVAEADHDYQLLPGSQAAGRGPNGADMGARIDAGATIAGTPRSVTSLQTAAFRIAGPGVTAFRYQLDDGPISDELPISTLVEFNNLSLGSHQLRVWGRNAIGQLQTEPSLSPTWTIAPAGSATIRINEIQVNEGDIPDRIELHNFGDHDVDIGGYGLSDRIGNPAQFVFPSDTLVAAGGYLELEGFTTTTTEQADRLNVGFGLNSSGDQLLLFSAAGSLLDSVEFGIQAHDLSLGRVDSGGWTLTRPTLGQPNETVPLGDSSKLVINEWYASGRLRLRDDHVELYNPLTIPVSMGGLALTDEPFAIPRMSPIAALSFIGAQGYADFVADGEPTRGADHLAFRLNTTHEHIGLVDELGHIVDQVFYSGQTNDVSQGRAPDGANVYAFQELPTFGGPNITTAVSTRTVLSSQWQDVWHYEASGTDLGTAWQEPDFDDSSWQSGPGLLGNEGEPLPETLRTSFPIGDLTYYFRREIDVAGDIDLTLLDTAFSTIVDDGFIVYFNGQEILRQGMPRGDIDATTLANRNVNEAELEGPFDVPRELWRTGKNVFAVEVHQTRPDSSDIVFGLELTGTVPFVEADTNVNQQLFESLRISEIMYQPVGSGVEYIELYNRGDRELDISGVRLAGGIDFTFPANSNLSAGDYVVVAGDAQTFRREYGTDVFLAGQFDGRLNNVGDTLVLQMPRPVDTAILRFEYSPSWHVQASGQGSAIALRNSQIADQAWGEPASWLAAVPSPGRATGQASPNDLSGDGRISADDIDILCSMMADGDAAADLDQDGEVNFDDVRLYVRDRLNTTFGDVNLDGIFDSSDLVATFVAGKYEDTIVGNASWAEGDWNCDGDFTTQDFVLVFREGGYQAV